MFLYLSNRRFIYTKPYLIIKKKTNQIIQEFKIFILNGNITKLNLSKCLIIFKYCQINIRQTCTVDETWIFYVQTNINTWIHDMLPITTSYALLDHTGTNNWHDHSSKNCLIHLIGPFQHSTSNCLIRLVGLFQHTSHTIQKRLFQKHLAWSPKKQSL